MKTINLTSGPIFRQMIRFALPMIAGNILQQVYHLVDTLVVGKCIGSDALAAVGSAYTLMTFITSIIIGLCMGSGAIFSADYGTGNRRRLQMDTTLSFWFILAVTAAIALAVYPGMTAILTLLQTPQELMAMTGDYMRVVCLGILFVFFYNFFAYYLRAVGNSLLPLVFLGVSAVMNVGLDLWFVAVLKLGVAGAAWATVIAQAAAGLGLAAYTVIRLPECRIARCPMDWPRLAAIIANDIATGIQQSVMNFGILMIQGLVNSFGTTVMAAFAAAVKIDTLAYMPAQEFGNAYSLFVSQNYGAGRGDRIRQSTRLAFSLSATFCLGVSVLVWLFAPQLMGVFVPPQDVAVLAEGVRYLRTEGAMYIGIGILFLWYGYFRAISRPRLSLVLTIISLGSRVALSYALAPRTPLGVTAIWYAIPIGWLLADAAGALFYRHSLRSLPQQETHD